MADIDWTKSMQQTFEYYEVDPGTWGDKTKLDEIESCTINWDSTDSTLGYASIGCTDALEETYVRAYLIAIQNSIRHKEPLGTFLALTPSIEFDGKRQSVTLDAYTPLIELKETPPPLGYTIFAGSNTMNYAVRLVEECVRAPVVSASSTHTLYSDFVANLDDTWLTFIIDLIENAEYSLGLDELGRIIFEKDQDTASLQPVWTFTDDNSSILKPDITDERDLYDIPNVVEVIYSTNSGYMTSRIVNSDPNSPISTVNRGREIVYRDTDPSLIGIPTQTLLDDYATQLLREKSCLEHTVTYEHGYCPVKIGNCVMLNYTKAGLNYVKAKVTAQTIKCETGCMVEETAVYTTQLWR